MAGKNLLGEIHPVAEVHLDFLVEGGKFRHGNLIVPRIMLQSVSACKKYPKSRGWRTGLPWETLADTFIK